MVFNTPKMLNFLIIVAFVSVVITFEKKKNTIGQIVFFFFSTASES